MEVRTLPGLHVRDVALHLLERWELELAAPQRGEPERADLRCGHVHEAVVEAGEAQLRDAGVHDVPVELWAVVAVLQPGPHPSVEEREARRTGADREHDDVGAEDLPCGQDDAVLRQSRDLGMVRLDGAGSHVPVVARGRQSGGRAQVRQEGVLGQHGVETRLPVEPMPASFPACQACDECLHPRPERAHEPLATVEEAPGGGGMRPAGHHHRAEPVEEDPGVVHPEDLQGQGPPGCAEDVVHGGGARSGEGRHVQRALAEPHHDDTSAVEPCHGANT